MQFHILSFEGPDSYSRAGGIASRIVGLVDSLAAQGLGPHLWFVGDPKLPGHETKGGVHLHRWCQWISEHHPWGVYDGQEGKALDYGRSLPAWILARMAPALLEGGRAVVLAEEWHTVGAVLRLDRLLHEAGLRSQVSILWNANNTFEFERIPWQRLAQAATITTVSRYMKQWMKDRLGVDALVIPNGLEPAAYQEVEHGAQRAFQETTKGRLVVTKVARFDPDKRWLTAVDVTRCLRDRGQRPLFVARGGLEAHGADVLARARAIGLRVVHRRIEDSTRGMLEGLRRCDDIDMLVIDAPIGSDAKRLLYWGSSAVLVNSVHEPFGLVGLEAMAVGGVACTGGSGEDYAEPGVNALVMQTDDAIECVRSLSALHANPSEMRSLRKKARRTSLEFSWPKVVRNHLMPSIAMSVT